MKSLTLPKILEPYRRQIQKTAKPFWYQGKRSSKNLRIDTHEKQPKLFESKIGGNPYLPKGAEHPLDENGNPMVLLAQYSFEDIPQNLMGLQRRAWSSSS